MRTVLERFYGLLQAHYGPTGWWPADGPFEIAVGAILVQNTAWSNVEKAIANLKRERLLNPRRLLNIPLDHLEALLKPAGFFRVKARRLLSFCQYLVDRHGGSMKRMARVPLAALREDLLAVHGIGPETADDILLYACRKPIFVVDAYTRRILARHGLVRDTIGYHDLQKLFHRNLAVDVQHYGEYHGLIVFTAKDFCRTRPRCELCPLAPTLKSGQPLL